MILKDILTAITLGLIGGFTPGPIILLALSEIVQSPKDGLKSGGMYILFAALTEFCIALFLVATSTWLHIPPIVFHILSFVGVALLMYIAWRLFQIKKVGYGQKQEAATKLQIVTLMFFNGPMWLFWISVCLPIAFSLGNSLPYGQYLFIVIFEISMVVAVAAILFGFNALRKYFTNEKVIRRVLLILSVLLFFTATRILLNEIHFFL